MSDPSSKHANFVIDTNALIWYLRGDKKLKPSARQVFTQAEHGHALLYVSSISIAEMYYVHEKWGWFNPFSQMVNDLKSRNYIRLIPFFAEDVLAFDTDFAVPEMHDRIIAGLARRLNAPLITSDPVIAASGIVTVIW